MWNPEATRVYTLIDKALWEKVYHNPILFLRTVERSRLNAVTHDRYYLDVYDRVIHNFDDYLNAAKTWFKLPIRGYQSVSLVTSLLSLVCMNRCRSMPVVWEFYQVII